MLEKPEEWTIQRHWQHCILKTGQYRDTGNIVHTRLDNTEKLATLYTLNSQNGSTGHTGGGHFIRTVHVLNHGHFTDIVSALAI